MDLTLLAITVDFKSHSWNMTAIGVEVNGTLLNKTVSMRDNLLGLIWCEIPDALQCYAPGDIQFGFITSQCLLLRDVFPNPDMLCR